jgi:hypothetical protein
MPAKLQFKLNATCCCRDIKAGKWANLFFHLRGLLRAIFQLLTLKP